MKILALGDIHGRTIWKDIIKHEEPDKIIFLGDYVSTHENITPAQQLENLEEILAYKEAYPDKVVLLRGNHDLDGLDYDWAECWPGVEQEIRDVMGSAEGRGRFLAATSWVHYMKIDKKPVIFSHAGITTPWCLAILGIALPDSPDQIIHDKLIEAINAGEPSAQYGFTPESRDDCYGTDPTQSCTWVRPSTLLVHAIPGCTQVVGHTCLSSPENPTPCYNKTEDGERVYFCDCLAYQGYLVIEDGVFKQKTLQL